MDDLAIGRTIRSARVRLRLRQEDLAARVGLTRTRVSEVENGRVQVVRVGDVKRIAAGVGLRMELKLRAARRDLDQVVDAAHSGLVDAVATVLQAAGWLIRFEPTGGSGAIDILAFHPATRMLLVVEVKSRLVDIGQLLRDLTYRLASARAAADSFGWAPSAVSTLLVVAENTTQRRIVASHRAIFSTTFPLRGHALRRWLAAPQRSAGGLMFLPYAGRRDVIQGMTVRVRPNKRDRAAIHGEASFARAWKPRSSPPTGTAPPGASRSPGSGPPPTRGRSPDSG